MSCAITAQTRFASQLLRERCTRSRITGHTLDPAQASSPNLKAAWNACPYGAIVFDSDAADSNAFKCNMCMDKLVNNQNPVCVMACPVRALDFGPISQLQKTYGTNQQLEQMPAPATEPSIVFKPKAAKPLIVPYDATAALQLNGSRGAHLPPVYTDPTLVTNIPPGVVGRSSLVLRHNSVEDLMRADAERRLEAELEDQ